MEELERLWANPDEDLPFNPNANTIQIILCVRDAWPTLDLPSLRRVHQWIQFVVGLHRLQKQSPPRVLLRFSKMVYARIATVGKTPDATYPTCPSIGAYAESRREARNELAEPHTREEAPELAIDADKDSNRGARTMSCI